MMGLKVIHASLQPALSGTSSCNNKLCSHLCVPGLNNTASCMCPFGFTLDGRTCVEQGYMLVCWRRTIRRLNLNGHEQQVMIDVTQGAISIDIHFKKGLVFWSDVEEHRIYRAPLEQLNNKTIVANVEICDDLAVDWVHDVLYWTDVETNALEAASLDGSNRTALITQGLDQPRALALDPLEGKLFVSDWGSNPKIESTNLDGSNRNVIVKDDIFWPNGLAIDLGEQRLYWADGRLQEICSCLYDGSSKVVHLKSQTTSIHLFGISLLDGFIYWTDLFSDSVIKSSKNSISKNITLLATSAVNVMRPYGIKVVHSTLQRLKENPCTTMHCKGLCVGSPSEPGKAHCVVGKAEQHLQVEHVPEQEINEIDDMTIQDVRNESFQLHFTVPKTSIVAISWKCVKREGCSVDKRCSEVEDKTKMFSGNNMPFIITELLPTTKYFVRVIYPNGSKEFHVTTSNTDPPELPIFKSVDVRGRDVSISWSTVDTCVPHFNSYNFKLYKTTDLSLVGEGSTNMTEKTFINLPPLESFTMHLYTTKQTHFTKTTFETEAEETETENCQEEEFMCNGKADCSNGRDEDINICAGIENLIVYKKTRSDVYFRCTVTNRTAKHLTKFSGTYRFAESQMKEHFESLAERCILWPDSYCFHVSALLSAKMYFFDVSAVVKDGRVGNVVSSMVVTKEGVPGPPEDLHAIKFSPNSVEIQWRHPNQSNGIIRNFLINIHEVETFIEDRCCHSFPMIEAPVQDEAPLYSAKPEGLNPASTYAISITAKTLYLGNSREIDVSTPPPPMGIVRMPDVDLTTLSPITWKLQDDKNANQTQYHPLIKYYLLLLLSQRTDLTSLADSGVDVRPIKPLLEEQIGKDFLVLWKKNAEEEGGFKERIKVEGLTPHKQHELVWVQVSQYKDVYGLDHIVSNPFIAL